MKNVLCRSLLAILPIALSAITALASPPAQAAIDLAQDAADAYFHDWTFAAMSPDRHWLAYSSNMNLFVVDTQNASRNRQFSMPAAINGLAIANNGKTLAVVINHGPLALIDLGEAEHGTIRWTVLPGACQAAQEAETARPAAVPPAPIALSGDARLLAGLDYNCQSDTSFVKLIDVKTRAIVKSFPLDQSGRAEAAVRAIEFVDNDSKLDVLSQETQAQWNIQSGELQNMARFDAWLDEELGGPSVSFQSAFDRSTGIGYLSGEQGRFVSVDLDNCVEPVKTLNTPSGALGQIFAIGEGGDWIALVEGARVNLYSLTDNKRLASFIAPFDVAYLGQGRDLTTLVAVSRSIQHQGVSGELDTISRPRLASFRLPAQLARHGELPVAQSTRCRLPGEAKAAREISGAGNTAPQKITVPFSAEILTGQRMSQPLAGCRTGWPDFQGWGSNDAGEVWIDRCNAVDHVDLQTGKIIESLPTPRSVDAIYLTWFERSGFVHWQGDTVTFQGFHGEHKVLVTKPGWRAMRVFVEGRDTFGVLWAKDDFLVSNPVGTIGPMGTGVAIRYDFATLHSQQQMLAAAIVPAPSNSIDWSAPLVFDPERANAETEGTPSSEAELMSERFYLGGLHRRAIQAAPVYRWELSNFGSVRMSLLAKGAASEIAFWSGLQAWPATVAAYHARSIFDFDDGKAAIVQSDDSVDFFDGVKRRLLTHLPAEPDRKTYAIAWLKKKSLLAVDSCATKNMQDCRIHFYAIEP